MFSCYTKIFKIATRSLCHAIPSVFPVLILFDATGASRLAKRISPKTSTNTDHCGISASVASISVRSEHHHRSERNYRVRVFSIAQLCVYSGRLCLMHVDDIATNGSRFLQSHEACCICCSGRLSCSSWHEGRVANVGARRVRRVCCD